jgi:hypothetical protein
MIWNKRGRILIPSGTGNWYHGGFSGSHAVLGNSGNVQIYLTGRDAENRSRIGVCNFDIKTEKAISISENPILDLGERGTFDYNGTGYPFYVNTGNSERLYYTGWTRGVHVDFINDLGLAEKNTDQPKFSRISRASILPRNDDEPFGTGSVCVLHDSGIWKMWYTCFDRWDETSAGLKHYYHIRYAESDNGIDWKRDMTICIDADTSQNEYVVAKPFVLKHNGNYLMWYSYRGNAYKVGFAVSKDGKTWKRHDDSRLCIQSSAEGWDSEMVCYSSVLFLQDKALMFYNGNGYGKTGLGWAEMSLSEFNQELKALGYGADA